MMLTDATPPACPKRDSRSPGVVLNERFPTNNFVAIQRPPSKQKGLGNHECGSRGLFCDEPTQSNQRTDETRQETWYQSRGVKQARGRAERVSCTSGIVRDNRLTPPPLRLIFSGCQDPGTEGGRRKLPERQVRSSLPRFLLPSQIEPCAGCGQRASAGTPPDLTALVLRAGTVLWRGRTDRTCDVCPPFRFRPATTGYYRRGNSGDFLRPSRQQLWAIQDTVIR